MSEQGTTPERPPTSGPGSSVGAWREYAAAVTDSPVESWASMSREDIVELLDSDSEADAGGEHPAEAEPEPPVVADETPARPRRRGVWMVPTADGWVPEHELRARKRTR